MSSKANADNFNFWKKSDFEDYVCRHILPPGLSSSALSQKGDGFIFFDKGRARYENPLYTDITTASGQYKDILWSGKIDENGFIDGEGTGVLASERVGFSGKFVNGFPQGEITYRYLSPNREYDNYEISTQTIKVGTPDGEWASLAVDGSREFDKDFPYEVNRFGRIIKNREYTRKQEEIERENARKQEEQNEINRKKRVFANRQKIPGYDISSPEISYDYIKTLRTILSDHNNRENEELIYRISLSLASKMTSPVGMPADIWGLCDLLKDNPQIANATDIGLTWDDSVKVNMKDVIFDYLNNKCWRPRERVLYLYNYLYNDWGKLTEDEI